jgi:hypothetical protein
MTTTMAALNVPPLLALPREIRDMIIEDILLSPHPVPHARFSDDRNRRTQTLDHD